MTVAALKDHALNLLAFLFLVAIVAMFAYDLLGAFGL